MFWVWYRHENSFESETANKKKKPSYFREFGFSILGEPHMFENVVSFKRSKISISRHQLFEMSFRYSCSFLNRRKQVFFFLMYIIFSFGLSKVHVGIRLNFQNVRN